MSIMLNEASSLQTQMSAEPDALSLADILLGLQHYQEDSGLPRDILAGAIAHREEITPQLLDWLKQASDQEFDPGEDWLKVTYALYLLAQFREPRAYALILQVLRLPDEDLDLLLGDSLTEDSPRFLISTYDGDWEALLRLAEDEAVNEYSRSAALRAMSGLLLAGRLDRDHVIAVWKGLLRRWSETDQPYVHELPLSSLTIEVVRHRLNELRPELEAALDSETFDPMLISQEEVLQRLDSSESDPGFFDQWHHHQPITDVFAELGDWDYFRTPAERREAEARRNEKMNQYLEQLYRDNPEAARKLYGLGLSELKPAPAHHKSKPAKKKKRKLQRAARKKNRK